MKLPHGTILHPDYDRELIESDDYQAWTVATLIEILSEFPADEPVFFSRLDDNDELFIVQPIEGADGGSGDGVMLW